MVFNAKKKKNTRSTWNITTYLPESTEFLEPVCFASKHFVSCIIQISSPPVSSLSPQQGLILWIIMAHSSDVYYVKMYLESLVDFCMLGCVLEFLPPRHSKSLHLSPKRSKLKMDTGGSRRNKITRCMFHESVSQDNMLHFSSTVGQRLEKCWESVLWWPFLQLHVTLSFNKSARSYCESINI